MLGEKQVICGLNLYAFRKDIRALKNSMYPIEFYLLAETMNKGVRTI